jgi:pyruvate dehydrogenase E2 component (dihydrolipoamide acetyltransferase)
MTLTATMPANSPARRASSPYARRLARERGISLELLRGSGPHGRIVADDVIGYVPRPATGVSQVSAFACTADLKAVRELLDGFARTDMSFDLDDIVLRAAGCALEEVAVAGNIADPAVALEVRPRQLLFSGIAKRSLAPLRAQRLSGVEAQTDDTRLAATLSLRLVPNGDVRPVLMPLLADRAIRLVVAAGPDEAGCLLVFDSATIDEERAADLLGRFKGFLEIPLRLLA